MSTSHTRFRASESGAILLENAVMLLCVAIFSVMATGVLGTELQQSFYDASALSGGEDSSSVVDGPGMGGMPDPVPNNPIDDVGMPGGVNSSQGGYGY